MIEVRHLTKRYGPHLAVDDLSFTVPEGRIYGLLGPNGAGKSTTMNILTGYLSPTSGTVLVDGHDILEEPEAAKQCIGYLPEQPPLYTEMTVREYLTFAAELKKVKRADRAGQVDKAIRRTGLASVSDRLIRNLSKGFRQRVGVAQALLGAPKVIILDEPTVGLDPAQVIEIRRLIADLGKTHTVILSSHILSEVQAVCDHVLIIANGKLVANGAPDRLGEKLSPKGMLRVTALGSWETVRRAAASIRGVERTEKEREENGEVTFVLTGRSGLDLRAPVSRALAAAGCAVLGMSADTMSLEDVFLQLTESPEAKPADDDQKADDADAGAADAAEQDAPAAQAQEGDAAENAADSAPETAEAAEDAEPAETAERAQDAAENGETAERKED